MYTSPSESADTYPQLSTNKIATDYLLWPLRVQMHCFVSKSQILTVPSSDPEINRFYPAGDNQLTVLECPVSSKVGFPLLSNSFIVDVTPDA